MPRNQATTKAAEILKRVAGETPARHLSKHAVGVLASWWQKYEGRTTRYQYAQGAKQLVGFIAKYYGATPTLVDLIGSPGVPRPRTITWGDGWYEKCLAAASPRLRCMLLLCGVNAIRSGTAVKLTPANYADGKLRFATKFGAIQTMGVTHDLAVLIEKCTKREVPFVCQLEGGKNKGKASNARSSLSHEFRQLKKALGVPSELKFHDLRRTMARRVYELTKDARDCQYLLGHESIGSTIWYMHSEISETPASLLERARPQTERLQ